jgi:hypothetical protein
MESIYAMGLALGPTAESTGLALVEGVGASDSNLVPREFHVVGLESFAPGTEYMRMIERITELRGKAKISYVVVDQTAVGESIVRMFKEELRLPVYPVIIGTQHREHSSNSVDYVPKLTLVGELLVGFERRRLKISEDVRLGKDLAQEFVNYRNRRTSAASLNVDAWREFPSDHLVFATGLACWKLQHPSHFIYDRL